MSYCSTFRLRGLMLAGLVVVLLAAPSRAADNSLKLVPAEAAFYTASLNNRAQYDGIVNSKAIAKLKALPFVQKAWKEGFAELSKPGGAIEQYNALTKDPENQALLDLFLDMMSSETFVYGDQSLLQVFDLYSKVGTANRFASVAMVKPENRGKDSTEVTMNAVLKVLSENLDQIKVPGRGHRLPPEQHRAGRGADQAAGDAPQGSPQPEPDYQGPPQARFPRRQGFPQLQPRRQPHSAR